MSGSQRSVRVRAIVRRVRESIWLSLMAITLLIFGVGLALLLLTTTIGSSSVEGRPRRRGLRRVSRNRDRRPASIAAAWMRAAENEAASVLAFEELATSLTSLGAPDGLMHRSRSAAADERRHAVSCRAIARKFDTELSAMTVDAEHVVADADVTAPQLSGLARSIGILQIAIESQLDGIHDEGYSAALLQQGASTARSGDVAARLRSIAADEQRHAELAHDIVDWCAQEVGMPARAAVRCSRARRWLPKRLPPTADVPDEELVAAGLVPTRRARELWHAHCAVTGRGAMTA